MNYKIKYYNLDNIESELNTLISDIKLLVKAFNSTFFETIDPDLYDEDKYLLETLINSIKKHFISIMIIDKKTNKYDIVPFVILKDNERIFIIYNNKIIKDENIIKSLLQDIEYDINSSKIKKIKDDELVAFDYSTNKATYIYDYLFLINKEFYKYEV